MTPDALLNELLNTISLGTSQDAAQAPKCWLSPPDTPSAYVNDMEKFTRICYLIYNTDKQIPLRYTQKTFFNELERMLVSQRKIGEPFPKNAGRAFLSSLNGKPTLKLKVLTPISGILLTKGDSLSIGPFAIEWRGPDDLSTVSERCLHIGILVDKVFDKEKATECAANAFNDFCRIVHFISGRSDKRNIIRTGLPLLSAVGDRVYVSTDSYTYLEGDRVHASSMSNTFMETIPIDNDFFTEHPDLKDIWALQKARHEGRKLTDMQNRILSSALAVGESLRTSDIKDSILYSCIAVEALFSFDEGSLFRNSIGEQISEAIAFLLVEGAKERIAIQKFVKKIYSYRSAIAHGGDKVFDNDYTGLNNMTRRCIAVLLCDEAFKSMKTIDSFYQKIKEMKFS